MTSGQRLSGRTASGRSSVARITSRLAALAIEPPDQTPSARELAHTCFLLSLAARSLPDASHHDATAALCRAGLVSPAHARAAYHSAAARLEQLAGDLEKQHADPDWLDRVVEAFLARFDPAARRAHGLYFTPSPVVTFIVDSVDRLLRDRLGLAHGLADTSTWHDVVIRNPGLQIPPGTSASDPFVQILDPSAGTGAFLLGVIDRVHCTMMNHWRHLPLAERSRAWRAYVREHLLPRLHGLEWLSTPLALSHFAVASRLRSTGCPLRSSDLVSLWQADTLDPRSPRGSRHSRVARIRSTLACTVLLGNPPFSGAPAKGNPWIEHLMLDYKATVRAQERQLQRLSNLYVRFLRFIEWKADAAGAAVVGLVTDRGYLDGLLFQDVRRSVLSRADPLVILDLGGAAISRTPCSADENVFAIRQPVAVTVGLWQGPAPERSGTVRLAALRGTRSDKQRWLLSNSLASPAFQELQPRAPGYRLVATSPDSDGYARWPSLLQLIGTGDRARDRATWQGTGIKTRHDSFVLGMTPREAVEQVRRLAGRSESDAQLVRELHLCSTVHFDPRRAREEASEPASVLRARVKRIAFRPYDHRFVVWSRAFVCEPKLTTMRHLTADNLSLAVLRRDRSQQGQGFRVARGLVAKDYVSNIDDALIWPVYVMTAQGLRANVQPWFLDRLARELGVSVALEPPGADPLVGYLYGVQASPRYRVAHRDALCSDYPRIPIPRTASLFGAIAQLGMGLCALHLLEGPRLASSAARARPGAVVDRVRYEPGRERAWINESSWFEVPQRAWDHVSGSHRVCETWLAARKGRTLIAREIAHFRQVVPAVLASIERSAEIDRVIEAHGGWKEAFQAH